MSKISKVVFPFLAAFVLVFAFMAFSGAQPAAAQSADPEYTPVVDPYPVVVGVTITIGLEPSPAVTATVHWMVNANDGSTVYDAETPTATLVFTQAGSYTVGVVVSDTSGVYTNAWLLTVEESVKTPAEALRNLLAAVMMPSGPERSTALSQAAADVARALNVAIRGAVRSDEGGSVELRPVQPVAALSEEARALTMAAGSDVHFSWGAGWHNRNADLGAGTQLLSGVYFDPDNDGAFGTTEPVSGGLWVSSMYTPNVSLETAEYTATFTSTQWVDSDNNGMFDLLAIGSPWMGIPATITLSYEGGVYTETWQVKIGAEPKLMNTEGTSPQPAPVDAFFTAALESEHPFRPGYGWDVGPSLGMTDTLLYGAYFGGVDFGGVCNGHCVASFGGKTYESTDANGDGKFDFFLPGKGDTTVDGPGPWEFTVTSDDGTSETWIFILGATPQLVPAGGE